MSHAAYSRLNTSSAARAWVCAAAAALLSLALVPRAGAVTYEPTPSFCEPSLLRDYLAPLERMPKLRWPPTEGVPVFGSGNVTLSSVQQLVVGGGTVGFSLRLRNYNHPAHPRWELSATFSRVDWRGRTRDVIDRTTIPVSEVSRDSEPGAEFDLADRPAAYRLTIVARTPSGRRLGRYGAYFRVVPETRHARLGLNATTYRPEQTVFARVENRGTAIATYGVPYSIERFDGSAWATAPESPKGPWILPLLLSPPGGTGRCDSFWIPPTMPPGEYRVVKRVNFGWPERNQPDTTLTAGFQILP
jgi:hypothetical protein